MGSGFVGGAGGQTFGDVANVFDHGSARAVWFDCEETVEILNLISVLAQLAVKSGEHEVSVTSVGIKSERLSGVFFGFVDTMLGEEDGGENDFTDGTILVEFETVTNALFGIFCFAGLGKEKSVTKFSEGVFALAHVNRGLEGSHGLVILPQTLFSDAEVVIGLVILRIFFDGFGKKVDAADSILLLKFLQAALKIFKSLGGNAQITHRNGALGPFVFGGIGTEVLSRAGGGGDEKESGSDKEKTPTEWEFAP